MYNHGFDVLDVSYRFFDSEFPSSKLNDDNFMDYANAFSAIQSFAEFIIAEDVDLPEMSVEIINKYLKTHVPTSLVWYKDTAPLLVRLIQHLRVSYHRYLHGGKQHTAVTYTKVDQMIYHLIWRVVL